MNIYVCVGSSCHLKGSYAIIELMKEHIAKNNLTEIGTYNPNNNIMLIKFEYIDFITYIENNSLKYLNGRDESKRNKLLKKISYKK